MLTILAFSCERYLAICHPLYSYTMAGLKRTCRIIAALCAVSAVAAAPFAFYTTVTYWRQVHDWADKVSTTVCCLLRGDSTKY